MRHPPGYRPEPPTGSTHHAMHRATRRAAGSEPASEPPTRAIRTRLWWRGKDSNLRRQSRQIYSLIPLTAREPLRARTKPLIIGIFRFSVKTSKAEGVAAPRPRPAFSVFPLTIHCHRIFSALQHLRRDPPRSTRRHPAKRGNRAPIRQWHLRTNRATSAPAPRLRPGRSRAAPGTALHARAGGACARSRSRTR